MKLLLTFLGTGSYQPCHYHFDGDPSQEEVVFFSTALARNLSPDKIISLQTKGAETKHGAALAAALPGLACKHQPVSIPDGQSEAELWQIFAALTEHIPEGCTLHLDITHGFRSLPVLGFIALSYLRVTRKVTIGGIHYGAWEARDPQSNLAPVFDLTPFLALLDWTVAADQFLATGSAARLGGLLSQIQRSMWSNPGDKEKSDLPRKLINLGTSLDESSASLLLLRTGAFSQNSRRLEKRMEEARAEADAHTPPFLEVLTPVREHLLRFGNTDLATLRDLVGWLAERGQTAAALTLASEWLTSYAMVWCGDPDHHAGHARRQPYSSALRLLEPNADEQKSTPIAIATVARLRENLPAGILTVLPALSSTIRNARNDLNHAGFNDTPTDAASLTRRAQEVAASLARLPLP